MPPASSRYLGSGPSLRWTGPIGLLALAAAALLFATAESPNSSRAGVQALRFDARAVTTRLAPAGARRLARAAWQGGTYTTSTGESVRVLVTDAYPDGYAVGQRWADFFASLVHGSELGLVTVYVVTPAEITGICGDPRAIGCYGSQQLAIVGETVYGVTPEEVARHEYGHHVAANRLNPPWRAVDWGPKRWASIANVCTRVQQGTAFPGDEDAHYEQNPGEGFAEVYRALNEAKAGATSFSWPIVDPAFYPDQAALQAAEQDVVAPWASTSTQAVKGRFVGNGRKPWILPVATELDGSLSVTLTLPRGALYDLTLLSADGRTVLAQGLWSGAAEKRLEYTVCGQRSVQLRVTRRGPAGAFSLQVTHA